MLVRDVMVAPVMTVGPSATVQEVAKLFLEKQISAVPVLDNKGKLVGIVSEGDCCTASRPVPNGTAPGGFAYWSRATRWRKNTSSPTAAGFRIS